MKLYIQVHYFTINGTRFIHLQITDHNNNNNTLCCQIHLTSLKQYHVRFFSYFPYLSHSSSIQDDNTKLQKYSWYFNITSLIIVNEVLQPIGYCS